MTRLNYVLSELFRNIGRHPGTTLSSFLSLALLLVLFDGFWIAAGTSQQFYHRIVSEVRMEAFVAESLPDSLLPVLADSVAQLAGVADVQTITRDDARQELARMVGTDLLVGYEESNPLPRSLVIRLDEAALTLVAADSLQDQLASMASIDEAPYGRAWLSKAERARHLMTEVGVVLGGLILLAIVIVTANSLRLMTQVRSTGLGQMRLLGAGRLMLAAPFLLESLLISGLAAAVGWIAVFQALERISFTQIEIIMPTMSEIAAYIGIAALVGLIAGFLGVRRGLR